MHVLVTSPTLKCANRKTTIKREKKCKTVRAHKWKHSHVILSHTECQWNAMHSSSELIAFALYHLKILVYVLHTNHDCLLIAQVFFAFNVGAMCSTENEVHLSLKYRMHSSLVSSFYSFCATTTKQTNKNIEINETIKTEQSLNTRERKTEMKSGDNMNRKYLHCTVIILWLTWKSRVNLN